MRLLIVSNRLPVNVSMKAGKYSFTKSAGGLVSGLTDYLNSSQGSDAPVKDFLWMGWPGMSIENKDQNYIRKQVAKIFKAAPVFFSKDLMEKVYFGFCNKTLWPLFHYFLNYVKYDREFWEQYKVFNENFRDELLKAVKPDDYIWVHDYHLMLLPALLRKEIPNPIGFFLHIPFPAYEIFRTLHKEARSEILRGLLGADLIGFHTYDYTQYFLRSVLRILGVENHLGEIAYHDRMVKAGTFPMGIDYEKFNRMDVSPHHSQKPAAGEKKIVLSVDRLDYSKGIINRLLGFELFLKNNPKWHNKVYMNMIVVPSRTGVQSYQQIKSKLDELVGNINGNYGNIDWTPVVYQYTSLPHKELIAQYRSSNVSLLTPLRDGMNLVAKEYVASLNDHKGVLILSEFTGAAKELSESLIINPYNIYEIAEAIEEALEVPEERQLKNNKMMQKRLEKHSVQFWANDFVKSLDEIHEITVTSLKEKKVTPDIMNSIAKDYAKAGNRIILTNYDRILVPFGKDFSDITPASGLMQILQKLSENSKTDFVVNSGRSKEYLDRKLGELSLHLTAEHGTFIKEAGADKWTLLKPISTEWKEEILPILETYTDRLPGSVIDEKEYSVAWYYNKADVEQASLFAQGLVDNLLAITANMNIRVDHGRKVVDVYHAGIDKSEIVEYFIEKKKYDFMLVIGDNWADEQLFDVLPAGTYSFSIGNIHTDAKYLLKNQQDAVQLLQALSSITK